LDNTAPWDEDTDAAEDSAEPAHEGAAPSSQGYIAVVSQWRKDGLAVVPIRYAAGVASAGGEPVVVSTFDAPDHDDEEIEVVASVSPHDSSVLDGAVGLVLPGGGDIDPSWYGATPHPRTRNVSHRRDQFEHTLLEDALAKDMPVLAICHGMQMLNVHLGGTLIQNLGDNPRNLNHDEDLPRADPVHGIRIKADSRLAGIFGAPSAEVNSHHHQGLDRVAGPLGEVAWADDGVLEAVESDEHSWVIGVQWHPEMMAASDAGEMRLFKSFVQATRTYERGESVERASA